MREELAPFLARRKRRHAGRLRVELLLVANGQIGIDCSPTVAARNGTNWDQAVFVQPKSMRSACLITLHPDSYASSEPHNPTLNQ